MKALGDIENIGVSCKYTSHIINQEIDFTPIHNNSKKYRGWLNSCYCQTENKIMLEK